MVGLAGAIFGSASVLSSIYHKVLKLDDKAETELKTALAKYYQNIGFGVQCLRFQQFLFFKRHLWHEIIMDVLDSAYVYVVRIKCMSHSDLSPCDVSHI